IGALVLVFGLPGLGLLAQGEQLAAVVAEGVGIAGGRQIERADERLVAFGLVPALGLFGAAALDFLTDSFEPVAAVLGNGLAQLVALAALLAAAAFELFDLVGGAGLLARQVGQPVLEQLHFQAGEP